MKLRKLITWALILGGGIGGISYYMHTPKETNSPTTAQNNHLNADKTLVFCIGRSPRALSPALVADGTSYNSSSRIIFNRLIENVRGGTDLIPALATSWQVSADSKTFTLKLRQGVKFNDNKLFTPTRDFNADDVLFTFDRMMNKDNPYNGVSNATYPYWNMMGLSKLIKEVKRIDDYTVEFNLNSPDVTFISTLAMDVLSIYSKEYADFLIANNKPLELFDQQPIGTGPWKLDQYIKDTAIRYIINPNYFRGPAKIGTVIFSITPDATSRLAKLINAQCDFMEAPNVADQFKVVEKYGLKTNLETGLNVAYIAFNNDDKILQDVKVRKALDMAVDKKAIKELVYSNQVDVDNHIITRTMLGYDANLVGNSYDPEQAKKLLAEAGYPNGFSIEIFVQPVSRSSNPNPSRTAELIQQDWKKIGVTATLRTTEYQEFIKQTREGKFQAGTYGWSGDNGDSDNFLSPLFSSSSIGKSNYSRFNDKEYDRLMQLGKTTADLNQRALIYMQAEKILFEKQPVIVLGHSELLSIMRPELVGYKQTPFGFVEFYGVDKLSLEEQERLAKQTQGGNEQVTNASQKQNEVQTPATPSPQQPAPPTSTPQPNRQKPTDVPSAPNSPTPNEQPTPVMPLPNHPPTEPTKEPVPSSSPVSPESAPNNDSVPSESPSVPANTPSNILNNK